MIWLIVILLNLYNIYIALKVLAKVRELGQ